MLLCIISFLSTRTVTHGPTRSNWCFEDRLTKFASSKFTQILFILLLSRDVIQNYSVNWPCPVFYTFSVGLGVGKDKHVPGNILVSILFLKLAHFSSRPKPTDPPQQWLLAKPKILKKSRFHLTSALPR